VLSVLSRRDLLACVYCSALPSASLLVPQIPHRNYQRSEMVQSPSEHSNPQSCGTHPVHALVRIRGRPPIRFKQLNVEWENETFCGLMMSDNSLHHRVFS
jgi:hypothetical protein